MACPQRWVSLCGTLQLHLAMCSCQTSLCQTPFCQSEPSHRYSKAAVQMLVMRVPK